MRFLTLKVASALLTSLACVTGQPSEGWTKLPDGQVDAGSPPRTLSRIIDSHSGRLWVVPSRGPFLMSRDNGRTWMTKPMPSRAFDVTGLDFTDGHVGWLVGSEGHKAVLASTVDGGESWEVVLRVAASAPSTLMDVRFFDKDLGIAVGNSGFQPLVAVTQDGGRSWQLNLLDGEDSDAVLRRVRFRSRSEVWAVGGNAIYVSRDGGSTWTLAHRDPGGWFNDLAFGGSMGIFVVGGFGKLLHSPDSGKTWHQVALDAPLANRFLWSVAFIDSKRGWIAGDKGTIAVTGDSGLSWHIERTNDLTLIRDIKAFGDRVFAVGDNAEFLGQRLR